MYTVLETMNVNIKSLGSRVILTKIPFTNITLKCKGSDRLDSVWTIMILQSEPNHF